LKEPENPALPKHDLLRLICRPHHDHDRVLITRRVRCGSVDPAAGRLKRLSGMGTDVESLHL
jgi:hypothetical protein